MHNVCKDKETNSSFTIIEKNETYKQKRSIYSRANKIDCFDILDVNKSYCKGVKPSFSYWFASDVVPAMLVAKNKNNSFLWELNSIFL